MKRHMVFLFISIAVVSLFIGFLLLEWRGDVSDDPQWERYIGAPIKIKDDAILIHYSDRHMTRFKRYSLSYRTNTTYHDEDRQTMKRYFPGEHILFHEARFYWSMHVGKTIFLIGRDTLESGQVIEYEYQLSETEPLIWETMAEFLTRRDQSGTTYK